jgi:phosphoglycolate phosphatase
VFEASLYEGVVEMLDGLAGSGHRLATATSKGEVPTRIMLDHFGLTDHFEVVGAATMDTTAVTKAQVLSRALAALGDPQPGQCVLVGDRSYDVEGAAAHGLHCIGATWGYGGADELRMAGAELLAARPLDVCALVDGGSFRT